MHPLEIRVLGRKRALLTVALLLAGLFTPAAGFAQPGRTFTPPPPPPPPPPPIQTFTPPRIQTFTPPPVIHNHAPAQMQHMQQNNQHMQHLNNIQQRTYSHFQQQQTIQQQAQFQRDQVRQNPAYQGPRTDPQPAWARQAGGAGPQGAPFGNNAPGGVAPGNAPAGVLDIVVVKVDPNSPGELAGFQRGDLFVSYAGQELLNNQHFKNLRAAEVVGDPPAELVVLRNGQLLSFAVPPGRLGVWLRGQ